MVEDLKDKNISRRDFLKGLLVGIGVILTMEMPQWVEMTYDEMFNELVEICTEQLEEDEIIDLMNTSDLEEALGLVFTFLITKGIEPEQYLILQDFLR